MVGTRANPDGDDGAGASAAALGAPEPVGTTGTTTGTTVVTTVPPPPSVEPSLPAAPLPAASPDISTILDLLNRLFDERFAALAAAGAPAAAVPLTAADALLPLHLFYLRQIWDVKQQYGAAPVYLAFLDLNQAYDCVSRPLLWTALDFIGVRGAFLAAIQSLYLDVQMVFHLPSGLNPYSPCSRGLRQGCPLSPTLITLYH